MFCSQKQPETEYHFLLTCPIYRKNRKNRNECFINFAWPNIPLFFNRMSTENKRKHLGIAKFIYIAFKQREKTLHKT